MRKLLLIAILSISWQFGAAQFVITPEGYKDSVDRTRNYIVIVIPGSTAEVNMTKAKEYITATYLSPKEVLSEAASMLSILGNTHVKAKSWIGDYTYSAVMTFKDDL